MNIKNKRDIENLIVGFVNGSTDINWRKINRIFLLIDFVLLVITSVIMGACIGYEIDFGFGGLIIGGILGLPAGIVIAFLFLAGAMLIVEMAESIAKIAKSSDCEFSSDYENKE